MLRLPVPRPRFSPSRPDAEGATASGSAPRPADRARALAWGTLLVGIAALLQLLQPYPWDADTAYHVAVARLMREDGLLHAFPWTPFSWLAENWADKELLFHLLLVPFAKLSYPVAAKVVGAIAGGVALAAGYAVLRAERVERAAIWSLVPLAASGAFVLRLALVRPHLLAIALALGVLWAAARRRWLVAAALAAVYPLAYIGWPFAIAFAVLAEVARALSGERPDARGPLAVAAGTAAGLLLHPDFPDIVRFSWLVNGRILVETAWGGRPEFDLGQEFQPFGVADALRFLLVPALLSIGALALALRRRREAPVALAFALAAGGLLALTLRTSRFVEYLAPFAAVAFALAASAARLRRATAAAVLAASFAFTAAFGAGPVRALATRGRDVPPSFAEAFRAAIPPGAQVFTCEWGLTGELLLALPGRRFLVALDPVLFWAKDPERYALWRRLTYEGGAGAAEAIRHGFDARFVLCTADPRWAPLLRSLTADPSVRRVVKSPLWYLYDLEPGAPSR